MTAPRPTAFKGDRQPLTPAGISLSPGSDSLRGSPNQKDFSRRGAEFLPSDESVCSRCGGTVAWPDGFALDKSKTFGRKSWCKACDSAKSLAYYRANRERILDVAAAKRGGQRLEVLTSCSECGVELEGRQRLTCGSAACRDRRFRRLHPEAYAERERQKVDRRRARRAEARERVDGGIA